MLSLAKLVAVLTTVYVLGVLFSTGPFFPTQASTEQVVNSDVVAEQHAAVRYAEPGEVRVRNQNAFQGNALVFSADNSEYWTAQMAITTTVDTRLSGILARTTLTQTFLNDTDNWVNATYYFPLPEDAAVDHMTFRVGDREIVGKIMPKEDARKVFEQARKGGKKASLVSQRRPNIFSNDIAHIGPGEHVTVTLEYQQSVTPQHGKYQLRLPLAITPRYSPNGGEPGQVNPVPESLSDASLQTDLDVAVHLVPGIPIVGLESPSHAIRVANGENGTTSVTFSGSSGQDRDFVLQWRAGERQSSIASWFTEKFDDEFYHLVMVSPPNDVFTEQDRIPRAWTFVLDISGSMSGESIRQAKEALIAGLLKIHALEYFNIIVFNDQASHLWQHPTLATPEAVSEAITFVSEIEADGGTEMMSALTLALDTDPALPTDVLQQIIFLTDGAVSNEQTLLGYIQAHIGQKRLFTVGIGHAPNGYFMREAASSGRGSFTFIASPEDVKHGVSNLLEALRYPALQDIEIDSDTPLTVMPSVLPDVYREQPLVLSFKTASVPQYLDLSALAGNDRRQWRAYLDSPTAGQGVHVLWARRMIDDLQKQRRHHASPSELTKRIQEVAMQHHIVSESTSLIAVDEAISNPTPEMAERKRLAASQARMTRLPQTATQAGQLFLNGLLLAFVALFVWICGRRIA